ncbi:MAG: glycosyltransferase [Taibaiella sp.]|nr:glycosyltransferase [Taibaiella sp.]
MESFEKVLVDKRISEIIIIDDFSKPEIRQRVAMLQQLNEKIKVFFQPVNRGMSRNKADAISFAKNEWCILFDSDNIIDSTYLDSIPKILEGSTIYSPSFASPNFDFRAYESISITRENAKTFMLDPMFRCFLNCCNYLVHRDNYLHVYEENNSVKQADTIHFNYLWLKNGGSFYFMKDCKYEHRVHAGSGFMENIEYNMAIAKQIEEQIIKL